MALAVMRMRGCKAKIIDCKWIEGKPAASQPVGSAGHCSSTADDQVPARKQRPSQAEKADQSKLLV